MVKKLLLGLSLIVFIAGSSNAQHINLGIKAGLNFYKLRNSNNVKTDVKVGYNVGLLGHIHMSTHWALQPEVYFSSQGAKANTTTTTLNYINIPVLFQYMFNNGFRLQLGPQLGILASAKSKTGNNTSDIKQNLKSTDMGLSVGVSYVHPPTGFGVDLRYNHGLTNINESDGNKAYNRGVQLGVFYLIKHRS